MRDSRGARSDPGPAPPVTTRSLPARAQFALGLVFVFTFVLAALVARFPIPYRDDWDLLHFAITEPFSIASLFRPHNEHVVALPRLLLALQLALDGASGRLTLAAALVAQAVPSWLLWREIRRRWIDDTALFVWGLTTVLMWSTYQLQSMVFGAALMFPLLLAWTTLGTVAALNATEADCDRQRWLVVAAVCAVAASLTGGHGMLVPAVLGMLLWMRRARSAVALAFVLVTVLEVAAYLALVPRASADATATTWGMIAHFLAFFGSALAYLSVPSAMVAGGVIVALCLYACTIASADRKHTPRLEWLALGLVVFVACGAAMAAAGGRASYGAAQAAQSRYATHSFACSSALAIWGLSVADRKGIRWRRPLFLWSVVAATFAMLPLQLFVGLVWYLKADNVAVSALALKSGVVDARWMTALHPDLDKVDDGVRLLRLLRDPAVMDVRLGSVIPDATLASCPGQLVMHRVDVGWAINGAMEAPGAGAIVLDRVGAIRGFGRPAPVVDLPDPPDAEYVRRAWSVVAGRRPAGKWIGFVAEGEGPPFVARVLSRDGRATCTTTIVLR